MEPEEEDSQEPEEDDEPEMTWETEAKAALEVLLGTVEWHIQDGFCLMTLGCGEDGEEPEVVTVKSLEEFNNRAEEVWTSAWNLYVPFDGGSPLFDADGWEAVEIAQEKFADELSRLKWT